MCLGQQVVPYSRQNLFEFFEFVVGDWGSGIAFNAASSLAGIDVAAKEALENSGVDITQWRTGFISANSVGGMDKTENFFPEFLKDNNSGDLNNVVNHECGAVTEITADALGIKDFVSTVSTACSSSANSIFLGARLGLAGFLKEWA